MPVEGALPLPVPGDDIDTVLAKHVPAWQKYLDFFRLTVATCHFRLPRLVLNARNIDVSHIIGSLGRHSLLLLP